MVARKTNVLFWRWVDYTFYADVELQELPYGSEAGLVFRVQDDGNYYLLKIRHNALELYSVVNGVYYSLGINTSIGASYGASHSFKVKVVDDTANIHLNNTQFMQQSLGGIHQDGSVGLIVSTGEASFSNIYVE